MLKKIKKSEKGSITVLVLSTMLFVTGVILVTYFSMMSKNTSQKKQLEKIEKEYNQESSMSSIYNDALNGELQKQ